MPHEARTHARTIVAPLAPTIGALARLWHATASTEAGVRLLALSAAHARFFPPLPRRGPTFATHVADPALLGLALRGLTRAPPAVATDRLATALRLHVGDPRLRDALEHWRAAYPGTDFAERVKIALATWAEPAPRPLSVEDEALLARAAAHEASLPRRRLAIDLLRQLWAHPEDAALRGVLVDAALELGDTALPAWVGQLGPPPPADLALDEVFTKLPVVEPRHFAHAYGLRAARLAPIPHGTELVPDGGAATIEHLALRFGREPHDRLWVASWSQHERPFPRLRRLDIAPGYGRIEEIFGLLDAPALAGLETFGLWTSPHAAIPHFVARVRRGARVPTVALFWSAASWLSAEPEALVLRLANPPAAIRAWTSPSIGQVRDLAEAAVASGRRVLRIESPDAAGIRATDFGALPVVAQDFASAKPVTS